MIGMIGHAERIIFCEGTCSYSQTCRSWVMCRWRCSPARVGIAHTSFYWKRHVFTLRVQTVGPVPYCMFDIIAATTGQQGRAWQDSVWRRQMQHLVCPLVLWWPLQLRTPYSWHAPKEKYQGALNQTNALARNRSSSSNPLVPIIDGHSCSWLNSQNNNKPNLQVRIAMTEWGLTAQINNERVGSSAWCTHLDTCA